MTIGLVGAAVLIVVIVCAGMLICWNIRRVEKRRRVGVELALLVCLFPHNELTKSIGRCGIAISNDQMTTDLLIHLDYTHND